MSKFDRAGNSKAIFAQVKEKTAVKAMTFRMVDVKHLMKCRYNREDVSYTEDIEKSIDELGFIDPVEVMLIDPDVVDIKSLKCLEGQSSEHMYLILSGHRRFEAALRKDIKEIPCVQINKRFTCDAEIENYVLMGNCHRNSSRDPMLYYKRYVAHRDYFNVNHADMKAAEVNNAIAARMGVTPRHIYRYRILDNVIEPLFEMVRNEEISLTGIEKMATLTDEEQMQVYEMFQATLAEHESNGEDREISRRDAYRIVNAYKNGGELYAENINTPGYDSNPERLQEVTEIDAASIFVSENTEAKPGDSRAVDYAGRSDKSSGNSDFDDYYSDEDEPPDYEKINRALELMENEQTREYGDYRVVMGLLDKLADARGVQGCDWADIKTADKAEDIMQTIANTVIDLIDEIHSIAFQLMTEKKKKEVLESIIKAAGKEM